MASPNEAYQELADWADAINHPDKGEFDNLVSDLIESILRDLGHRAQTEVTVQTRSEEHGKVAVLNRLDRYVENNEYGQFLTSE